MPRSLFCLLSLGLLAACTQPPAQVMVLGGKNYSRAEGGYQTSGSYSSGQSATSNNSNTVAPVYYGGSPDVQNNNSVTQTTQQVAPAAPIAVSDLSSPPPAASPAPASPPAPTTTQDTTVNPWTQKPRDAVADSGSKPFIWPVESNNITSSFGPKSTGKANDGITIGAKEGDPVWAVADGEVVYSDNSLKGYGNMVLVKHKGGRTTTYANLSRRAVEKYDRVKQGDIVGYVGKTGNAKTSQLYFAVRQGTDAIDPETLTKRP